ncbi:DUF4190 domain-containing protein [Nocardia terpenica]|uniref:DUF4190 domain-containing protein n=1 Tax=Nocardia terpenica TaxID=455432 RepID=UPI0018955ED5|nr:DUF4190 domain-containing protein [Nocardia terpenica]MBF6062980.1 DUF4190 domain-containing protein [Nocardia terpenica]MBF6104885.1 DUF4190 domain-containing protein [Nocardia terpenica]MBF6112678.1 DUF4190 domain-containing protein [Nocardia terpenica]MBF6118613.1 DUF4190 domain-containing protein [Nocardia terpenica]MBF6155092.1 DUF4190 domain-containing protein [Nocardia terpenica]
MPGRKQYSEADRWPETSEDDRWPVAETDEDRWEAAQRRRTASEVGEDRYDSGPTRRRTGRLRVEVPPIVNPYAIVALVAALLGLFPVAIVFGFISFTHPRGRGMALSALMLGVAEVVVLAGALVLSGATLPHMTFRTQAAPTETAATIVSVTPPQPTATTTVPTPPATTTSTASAPPTVTKGEVCTESQAALIGTTSDGSTLLCLKGTGGYRWTGPYTVSTAVYDGGAKCNAASDKTARTSDGHALVCERNTWSLWVE